MTTLYYQIFDTGRDLEHIAEVRESNAMYLLEGNFPEKNLPLLKRSRINKSQETPVSHDSMQQTLNQRLDHEYPDLI
ncbi:hypothetical protein GF327_04055 [Candidatus Woesearchaeota archaeon]|nr:hypothetical protein [Candidatus Woesearchaeota archaeon]